MDSIEKTINIFYCQCNICTTIKRIKWINTLIGGNQGIKT